MLECVDRRQQEIKYVNVSITSVTYLSIYQSWFIYIHILVRNISINLSVLFYIYPSISLVINFNRSKYQCIYICINISVHLSIYQCIYISINLSVYLYIYPSISVDIYLSIYQRESNILINQ